MAGFNTVVLMGMGKAVGASPLDWDDLLHIGTEYSFLSTIGVLDGTNGPTSRSSWSTARTIKVWKAQAGNQSNSVTVPSHQAKLYNATDSVTIYTALFGSMAVNTVASISGNPLTSYSLAANKSLKYQPLSGDPANARCGSAILFTADPASNQSNFDNLAHIACSVAAFSSIGTLGEDGTANAASFAQSRTLKLWKVIFGTISVGATNTTVQFKLYNATDAVIIYTATNPSTPASSTSAIIGTPLTSYALPANKTLKSTFIDSSPPATQSLACGFAFSAEP